MRLPSADDLWIVDDDPSTLELLEESLQRGGRRVRTFDSAAGAEHELLTTAPKVVVVDRTLGAADGLELINRIHATTWPAPVILISGNITATYTAHAMRRGVSMVFEKPFALEELIAEVDEAFERSASAIECIESRIAARQSLSALPEGHLAVMWELVACRPHKQIASRLDIALRTVEKRKKELFERLRIESLADLLTLLQTAGVEPATDRHRPSHQYAVGVTAREVRSAKQGHCLALRIDSQHSAAGEPLIRLGVPSSPLNALGLQRVSPEAN